MAKPAAKRQSPRRLRWRLLVERLCCHAKRAAAQAAGGPSRATRGLRHLLSGRARNARDVSVLRAIYLLRSRAREAHRRGQCLGPGRVHRLCRLGEGPHEADLTICSLVKAIRNARVPWAFVRPLRSKRKICSSGNSSPFTSSAKSNLAGRPTLHGCLWFFSLGSSHGKTLWSTSSLRPSSAGIGRVFSCSGDGNRDRVGGPECPRN